MCTYGIGLPFDHPIWRNLPPCRCGYENDTFDWGDGNLPQLPKVDAFGALIPSKCPDCGTWFQNEHRCTPPWKYSVTTTTSSTTTPDWMKDIQVTQ